MASPVLKRYAVLLACALWVLFCSPLQKPAERQSKHPPWSKYRGVAWYAKNRCWRVRFVHNAKTKVVGHTLDEEEGARWFDEWCKKVNRYDRMNFPHEHCNLGPAELDTLRTFHSGRSKDKKTPAPFPDDWDAPVRKGASLAKGPSAPHQQKPDTSSLGSSSGGAVAHRAGAGGAPPLSTAEADATSAATSERAKTSFGGPAVSLADLLLVDSGSDKEHSGDGDRSVATRKTRRRRRAVQVQWWP